MEDFIKLSGILIVIVGFALKKDPILIIISAAITTALVGGLGIDGLLSTLGKSFVANRTMAIFILIMLVTGTLERNGIKESSAKLLSGSSKSSPGMVIGSYGFMRAVFAAFNISFGGVAGFVRPLIMPMIVGTIESKGLKPNENHLDELKGMASGMENIAWFFCQVLFVGGSGALLVQSTLASFNLHVELVDLAKVEIPVAIFAVGLAICCYFFKDKKLFGQYYGEQRNRIDQNGGEN